MIHADVVVDARMRKRDRSASLIGLAGLTIGVGPGFTAAFNCDHAIESQWGPRLGTVLGEGAAADLGGDVREIDGHVADRVIYTPCAGVFGWTLRAHRLQSEGGLPYC